jgi:predicted peroxiredoxin
MGKQVTMYLTMEGTVWAAEGSAKGVEVGGFESLNAYIKQFFGLGGELLVCAPCSEYYCSLDHAKIQNSMISNAQLTGLATVVSKIGDNTKMVTF